MESVPSLKSVISRNLPSPAAGPRYRQGVFLLVFGMALLWTDGGLCSAAAQATLPPYAPGVLEIHQVNVQQGDCTLIVGPDGTTVLLDAGNAGKGTAEVVPYLAARGIDASRGLDFMIATHRDSDHLGGLDEVIADGYDVLEGIWDNGSSKSGGFGSQIRQFLREGSQTTAGRAQGQRVLPMPLGRVIQLGDGATAQAVAVGGSVLGHGTVTGATEENDLSVAILVRYGDFEYLTAGDLGGGDADRSCTWRSTGQANVETPLAISLMPGGGTPLLGAEGIEVLDVNHHGSESSTNRDTMNLLTPTVAVINTGSGQGSDFHHPRNDVIVNVLMAQADCITARPALVLQTEEGDPVGSNTTFAGFSVGDVMIRTTGVGTFDVFATGEVDQGPDERLAAGIPAAGRSFPLDGAGPITRGTVVITEITQDPAAVPDTAGEWFEVFNPGTTPVDVEGWTIRDDDADSHVILHGGPLVVPPGRFLVFGRNGDSAQNGGYVPDYVYSGINLANGDDEIVLLDVSGREVDRAAYLGRDPWPDPTGASMHLSDPAIDNHDGASWIVSGVRGAGFVDLGNDSGTPGELSPQH